MTVRSHPFSPPSAADQVVHSDTRSDGYVLVQVALAISVLLISAAFAVDFGLWFNTGSHAQRAADAASIAAVAELTTVEDTTGDRVAAEAAAVTLAEKIAEQNGFDPADPKITVTVNFTTSALGADEAEVIIKEADLPTIFSHLVLSSVDSTRSATASLDHCDATCAPSFVLPPGVLGLVTAGTGGDGFAPTVAGTKIFNIFHHNDDETLVCTDMLTQATCVVGGDSSYYPIEAYSGMLTNYTPKLAAIDTKVYFIVQETNTVGLGCWDGDTHVACTGFANPWLLENYEANPDKNGRSRFDGPDVVGSRLFMYGDNNKMYCYDTSIAGAGAGYPKNTALAGVHDAAQVTPGTWVDGIDNDDMQFDQELAPDNKIYLTLDEVPGATWVHCWDPSTDAACAGFGSVSTASQRPFMFVTFDTNGNYNGICAMAGKGGGSGSGHECWDLSGNSQGALMPFGFDKDWGEQPAWGVTSAGHTRTFFPDRGNDRAECWDWAIGAQCAIAISNWSDTAEYAYISDGSLCIYGLGHKGKMWSFSIEDGQYPCPGGGSVNTTIEPCTCADGVTKIWTTLVLTPDTDLDLFDTFTITVSYPDGTVFFTGDLVGGTTTTIDLTPLNDESPPPSFMRLVVSGYVVAGQESIVFAAGNSPGVALLPGIIPILID